MGFNFSATGNDEIMQNVNVILSTPVGSVPFDREFGVDMSFLDLPMEQAKANYTVEVIQKIRRYEPRAQIEEVTFDTDATNGKLTPRVVIELA
jgi:uncharacterized protein